MKNQLLSFSILLLFNYSVLLAAGNGSGTDCPNATPYVVNQEHFGQYFNGQSELYFEFATSSSQLALTLAAGTQSPFADVFQIEVYENNNNCANLQTIFSTTVWDPSDANFAYIHGLSPNNLYLLVLKRDVTSPLSQAYFKLKMAPHFTPPITGCGTETDCFNNLIKNGMFSSFTVNPSNSAYKTNAPFDHGQVCNWTYGVSSPNVEDATSSNPYTRLNITSLNAGGKDESIAQTVSLDPNKSYELGFSLKTLKQAGRPGNVIASDFKVYGLSTAQFNSFKSSNANTFNPALYSSSDLLATVTAVNMPGSSWDRFIFCVKPTKSNNVILFTNSSGGYFFLDIDDIFLREFRLEIKDISLADNTVYLDCPAAVIGDECAHEGGTYNWTRVGSTDHSHIGSRVEPFVQFQSSTDKIYNIVAGINGNPNCVASQQVTFSPLLSVNSSYPMHALPNGTDINDVINTIVASGSTSTWGVYTEIENTNFVIQGEFIINNNTKIRFKNCTFYCDEGSSIKVEKGSDLYLHESVIQSCNGSKKWEGIQVEGDANLDQSEANQGRLWLKFSTISRAKMAISAGLFNQQGTAISNTGGGIIVVESSTLFNNISDVYYHPYHNFNQTTQQLIANAGRFVATDFLQTENISTIAGYGSKCVELNEVDGVTFTDCQFKNTSPLGGRHDYEIGIEANSASFKVRKLTTQNLFEGFEIGISSSTASPLIAFEIDYADFINNKVGVYVAGNDFFKITRSNFEMDNNSQDFGIYMAFCNGYEVEENSFTPLNNSPSSQNAIGISCYGNDSEVYLANQLYNNSFDDLDVGILVHGDQRLYNNKGLQLLCNDFTDNSNHIALKELLDNGTQIPDIAEHQGKNPSVIKSDPAGNTFNGFCGGPVAWDIEVDASSTPFTYHHHDAAITTPVCYTNNQITLFQYQLLYTKEDACPTNISSGSGGGGTVPDPGNLRKRRSVQGEKSVDSNQVDIDEVLLADYIRYHLLQDTLGLDSIILALDSIDITAYQIRYLEALRQKRDPLLNGKALQNSTLKAAFQYVSFAQEAPFLSKNDQQLLKQPKEGGYIWARAKAYQQEGLPLPMPFNAPKKKQEVSFKDRPFGFEVYPNPSSGTLTLEFLNDNAMTAAIFSLEGKRLKSVPLNLKNKQQELNVSDLPNGMYVIQVLLTDGKNVQQKLMIQR